MSGRFRILACGVAALVLSGLAHAQPYPSRPIRIVVPFTPGSASDILARIVSDKLATAWSQPVLVENRPGAGGTIGTGQVARAPADGYTFVVVSAGHIVNPVMYASLPYDTLRDLAGVIPLANLPSVLVVSAESGITTVAQLVARARARPGELNYSSGGIGSGSHVNAEKFRAATGVSVVHIPLKGAPEMVTETVAGRTQFGFLPIIAAVPALRDGRLRALGVSTARRSSLLADVPTLAESGVPGATFDFWIGMLAPAQTPKEIVAKLNSEIARILQLPDIREKLGNLGAEPMPMSPADFDAYMRAQFVELGKLMREAGVQAQ